MNNDEKVIPGPFVTEPDLPDLTDVSGDRRIPRVAIKSPISFDDKPVEIALGRAVLKAVASDFHDGNLTSQIQWSTTARGIDGMPSDGILGVGGTLEVALPRGEQTVTAKVVDSDGWVGLDSVVVLATAPVIEKLESGTDEDETGGG